MQDNIFALRNSVNLMDDFTLQIWQGAPFYYFCKTRHTRPRLHQRHNAFGLHPKISLTTYGILVLKQIVI